MKIAIQTKQDWKVIQSMTASRESLSDRSVWALKHLRVFSSLHKFFQVFTSLFKSSQVFSSLLKSIQVFSNFGTVISKAFWHCHFQSFLAMSFPKLFGNVISRPFWQCHFQSFLAMSFPNLLTNVPDKQEQQEQQEVSKSFLRLTWNFLQSSNVTLTICKVFKLNSRTNSWQKVSSLQKDTS